jgi:hypothetical protein
MIVCLSFSVSLPLRRPTEDEQYPEVGRLIRQIPEGDRRYLQVVSSVKSRRPRREPERNSEVAEALGEIRDDDPLPDRAERSE